MTKYRLLITGSRKATLAMLEMARDAVDRAHELDWSIIVGDAVGMDAMVIDECITTGIDYHVYGITPEPRNGPNMHYTRVPGNFLARDRYMVELADRCLAICRGYSRGTMYTYNCALKAGIPADIRHFT